MRDIHHYGELPSSRLSPIWRWLTVHHSGEPKTMNRIKELRDIAGLTLEQVAEKAGTSFQQVQRLETGKRRLTEKWMRQLAPALGVQPHELMTTSVVLPSQQDSIGKRLEPIVIQLWRTLDKNRDRRGMEIVLRAMAPPGFKMPSFDDPSVTPARRKRK
jgi:transcriptional regulator with XRE-family HTH domain